MLWTYFDVPPNIVEETDVLSYGSTCRLNRLTTGPKAD